MDQSVKVRQDESAAVLFKTAREAAGVSISGLAKKCAVSELTLKKIERGDSCKFRTKTVGRIIEGAIALGMNFDVEKVFPGSKPTIYDSPLKTLRITMRMDQVELANKLTALGCQIDNSHISHLEAGRLHPSRQLATDLVHALKLLGSELGVSVSITELELLYPERYMKQQKIQQHIHAPAVAL